jgi:hypothetical protein
MPKLESSISDKSKKMLVSFKKVVDTVIGEEMHITNYLDLVIDKGIKAILSDIIPKETDVLWNTIERISEANPEFMSEFVVEALKRGEELNKQAAKQKLGYVKK